MHRIRLIVALASLVALAGMSACSREGSAEKDIAPQTTRPQSGSAAEPAPIAQSGHAPAGVTPGSHEDWCGEHQVPESQCTRCNQDLVAAFKATGDWCEEHGLPESQCLKCNPELEIVRPPPGAPARDR
jgi:hypothetical protein